MDDFEIIRGIKEREVLNFGTALFFSEAALGIEGVIDSIVDARYSAEELALYEYAMRNKQDYDKYWREQTGSDDIRYDNRTIRMYVDENGLGDEFMRFRISNANLLRRHEDPEEIRQKLFQMKVLPVFKQMKRSHLYIYRDSDRTILHVFRKDQ